MTSGRGKCRADGCKTLVEAKVKVSKQIDDQKIPCIGLCAPHAIEWLEHLLRGGYPAQPFALKPHQRPRS